MRVAFLCDAVYPFHQGGKETLQYERAIRLARRGHAVRIHTMHWWGEREPEIVRDGLVLDAMAPRVGLYTRRGGRSIWESVVVGLASFRLLWAPDFDVLDVDQFPFTPFFAARLLRWLRRRPLTATWHEVWDEDYWRHYMGWLAPVGVFLQRFAAHSADLVFANSSLTARRLADWLGVDPRRIIVLSPGTLPIRARGEAERRDDGGKTTDCLFVGRLLPHKHVDAMLRALAELPGVTGLVLGSGPEKARLVALAQQLGLDDRVRFEAPDGREAIQRAIASARLFVFPSTREGFGIAVLEANGAGVPALVVQHPDNAAVELIQDDVSGMIVSLDPPSMAKEIRRYLADPQLQASMSQAARSVAARFSWDAYASRMESALQTLVEPAGRHAKAA